MSDKKICPIMSRVLPDFMDKEVPSMLSGTRDFIRVPGLFTVYCMKEKCEMWNKLGWCGLREN